MHLYSTYDYQNSEDDSFVLTASIDISVPCGEDIFCLLEMRSTSIRKGVYYTVFFGRFKRQYLTAVLHSDQRLHLDEKVKIYNQAEKLVPVDAAAYKELRGRIADSKFIMDEIRNAADNHKEQFEGYYRKRIEHEQEIVTAAAARKTELIITKGNEENSKHRMPTGRVEEVITYVLPDGTFREERIYI